MNELLIRIDGNEFNTRSDAINYILLQGITLVNAYIIQTVPDEYRGTKDEHYRLKDKPLKEAIELIAML